MTTNETGQPSVWSQHNAAANEAFAQAAKQHAIEPFLLCQKPRRTRLKKGKGRWFFKLFILPHTFWAASLLVRLVMAIVVALFGQTVSGRVIDKISKPGKTPTYTVEYSYQVAQRTFRDKNKVSKNQYTVLKTGDVVAVRVLKASPATDSQIVFSGESRWSFARSLFFETFFINFIVGAFVCALYVVPYLQRRLVANGLPTAARIVSVEEVIRKGKTFHVEYEFVPVEYANAFLSNAFQAVPRTLGENQTMQSQMTLSEEDGQNVRVGEWVTVLFDASKPKRNLLYRFADYEVVA